MPSSVFDPVADLYDRVRPQYPDALFDDLVALSCMPERGRILEVGCGTGQATIGLAGRGYPMVCLEPGLRMAALARRNLSRFPHVTIVEQTFEVFSGARANECERFDLVMSAQAFHWVPRAVRFDLAADALRPGGALAILAHHPERPGTPLRRAMDDAYARAAPSLAAGSDALRHQVEEDFATSHRFRALPVRACRWSRVYPNDDYLSLLQTHSDHIQLPPGELAALVAHLRDVLAAHGTEIVIVFDTHLMVGHRVD